MSLVDIVRHARWCSGRERENVPRGVRIRMALREVELNILSLICAPDWLGDAAMDAIDMEHRVAGEHREKLRRGEFPRRGFEKYVVDGDYVCEKCDQGHLPGCDSLRSDNLDDCLWKSCKGCCPDGCPEHGLARYATVQGEKLRRMIAGGRESTRHDPESDEPPFSAGNEDHCDCLDCAIAGEPTH